MRAPVTLGGGCGQAKRRRVARAALFALLLCSSISAAAVDLTGLAEEVDQFIEELFAQDARVSLSNGNYTAAREKFEWLAERGNLSAQHDLGLMYESGHGILPDYDEALKWYRMAAENGYPAAQIKLARMYYLGRGVSQSDKLAYVWLYLAAARGDKFGRSARDKLAALMDPEQVSAAQQLAMEWAPLYNPD